MFLLKEQHQSGRLVGKFEQKKALKSSKDGRLRNILIFKRHNDAVNDMIGLLQSGGAPGQSDVVCLKACRFVRPRMWSSHHANNFFAIIFCKKATIFW